ncbi:hypothetical protein [Paraburkholderia terrae]|uniref:hypothetical protein n=1 Tax=Paraburkholderia terrae TaxID=311230 RepID=UPI0012DFEC69|nr:hypothetical protein [Paraburkholderia terrae]
MQLHPMQKVRLSKGTRRYLTKNYMRSSVFALPSQGAVFIEASVLMAGFDAQPEMIEGLF